MKSNRLFLRRRTRGLLFATLLFLLSSCTIGYHEDESFESDVKNATLESPQLENVACLLLPFYINYLLANDQSLEYI